jgi:hypothetical protein
MSFFTSQTAYVLIHICYSVPPNRISFEEREVKGDLEEMEILLPIIRRRV